MKEIQSRRKSKRVSFGADSEYHEEVRGQDEEVSRTSKKSRDSEDRSERKKKHKSEKSEKRSKEKK